MLSVHYQTERNKSKRKTKSLRKRVFERIVANILDDPWTSPTMTIQKQRVGRKTTIIVKAFNKKKKTQKSFSAKLCIIL